jgi:hypothetical protein
MCPILNTGGSARDAEKRETGIASNRYRLFASKTAPSKQLLHRAGAGRFHRKAELRTVVAPISQEAVAARVGTTRTRINYFMNKFPQAPPDRVQRRFESSLLATQPDCAGLARRR